MADFQRTFGIIKRDAVSKKVAGQIIARIEESGLSIVAMKRIQLDPETALVIIRLRAPEAGDSLGLGIAMRARLGGNFAQFVDDMLGRRLVRIAHAKVDNVAPGLPRGMPHRVDFGDDIGGHAFDTIEFVGHSGLLAR